jgi:hypothetical protein
MKSHSYRIAPARTTDVPLLPAIELAASRLFVGYAAAEWILAQTTSEESFRRGQRLGRLWVALAGICRSTLALALRKSRWMSKHWRCALYSLLRPVGASIQHTGS